jgi:hypothetical protein
VFRLLNPFLAGRQVCKPSRPDRVEDPAVRRIQLLRTFIGLAAVVWITVSFQLASDAKSLGYQRLDQVVTSAVVLAVTFPVVVGVFIAATRPSNRRLYFRRALKPFGALLALCCAVLYLVLVTSEKLTGGPMGQMPEVPTTADYMWLLYQVFLALLCLWAMVFVVYGAAVTVVHVFRTTDVHEVLPPIIAIVLVWELGIMDLFSDAYTGVPATARAAMVLGGPLSVTAVSLWELRRLKTRHNLTLRQALGR